MQVLQKSKSHFYQPRLNQKLRFEISLVCGHRTHSKIIGMYSILQVFIKILDSTNQGVNQGVGEAQVQMMNKSEKWRTCWRKLAKMYLNSK